MMMLMMIILMVLKVGLNLLMVKNIEAVGTASPTIAWVEGIPYSRAHCGNCNHDHIDVDEAAADDDDE